MRSKSFLFVLAVVLAGCSAWQETAGTLGALEVQMPDLRAGFRKALDQIETGQYDRAEASLEYLLAHDPVLQDHYLYELGIVAEHQKNRDRAIEMFTRLYQNYPRSVRAPAAALELGRLYLMEDRLDDADNYLTLARNTAWSARIRLEAGVEQARLALARGDAVKATSILTGVRHDAGPGAIDRDARGLQQAIWAAHPELAPSGPGWLDEAELLLRERQYMNAEKAVRAADPNQQDPHALMLLAASLKGQGAAAAAATVLAKVVDRFPSDPLAAKALFRMGSLFWNSDEDVSAEAAFEEFLRRFPAAASAPEALYAVARIRQSSGRIGAAVHAYQRLAQTYPNSRVVWDARWRIGWIHFRNDRYRAAVKVWSALARDAPGQATLAEARYWEARALEQEGHTAAARALYQRIRQDTPTSYYAGEAEKRLGIARPKAVQITAPALEVPPPPQEIDPFHVSRYEALHAAQIPDLARAELRAIEREDRSEAARQFLLHAYLSSQAYRTAMHIAAKMDGRLPESLRQRIKYPLGFWKIVRTESERNHLDPLLVAAVIRQESLFDPKARSSANAIGLMQLLPSTARREAKDLGWSFDPTDKLDEPEVNLVLGIRHLREQIDNWNGDLVKALAAYNGGIAAVQKWERRYGALPQDEFVESITYRETRDYVKRVLSHYRTYVQLYGSGPGLASAR